MRHCTYHHAYHDDCHACLRAERSNLGFGRDYGYSDDNAGRLGVDIGSGDLTVGVGNVLAIDTRTGDLDVTGIFD